MRILNLITLWVSSILMVLLVLGGFISSFNSIVPSPLMVSIALDSAFSISLFMATFYWGIGDFGWGSETVIALSKKSEAPNTINVNLPEKPYIRAPLMGLLMFLAVWVNLGSALPWLTTLLIGSPGEMSAVVDGWHSKTARSCTRPTLAHVLPFMMNGHTLCIDQRFELKMPPGTVIRITGKASPFGIIPDDKWRPADSR